jgi:hypothetical protein
MKIAAVALLYFLSVYAAGFLFGTIRVLAVEPRLGPIAAVLCEAPFLMLVMIAASRWAPRAAGLPLKGGQLLLTGFGALIIQQITDAVVGATLLGLNMAEQIARFATAEGVVYAALLILFALMPALTNKVHKFAPTLSAKERY